MKRWRKIKKSHLAAVLTCILVLGTGTAVLANASGLNSIFEPKDFKSFENQHNKGEEYDSAAGDGEEFDLADEDGDSDDSADKDVQRAFQVAGDKNISGPADKKKDTGDSDKEKNPDVFEVVDKDGQGGIHVNPDGSGNGNTGNKTGSNPEKKENGNNPGKGGNGNNPGKGGSGNNPNNPGGSGDSNKEDETNKTSEPTKTNEPKKTNEPIKPSNTDAPVPTDNWEDQQLKPRDPVQTEDGVLIGLSAVIHREYYQGDVFQEEDATVTAVFQSDEGKRVIRLPYGGENGYDVQISTKGTGKHTATFTYMGISARAPYEVISSGVKVFYYGLDRRENNGYVYGYDFPGPLGADQDTMDKLPASNYYPTSGGTADLTDIHSRMIAYLGDERVEKDFDDGTETGYKNVVFLKEQDGYLKTMLAGFQYYTNGKLEEEGPYLYYPIYNWGSGIRHVTDVVVDVAEEYKIRRVVQNEGDLKEYRGSQVMERYIGNESALSVPMGVTDIELKGEQGDGNTKITSLILPESVSRIDFASIAGCLPDLQAYEVSGNSAYQSIDGVLYSKDGQTLISVPAGKTNITIPDTVRTIAQGAFCGSQIRELNVPGTVTRLEAGCFDGYRGEMIRMEGEELPDISGDTGYAGKILFADSEYDVLMKKGIFAFKSQDIIFGAMDEKGTEILEKRGIYLYDGKRNILTVKEKTDTLAGIWSGSQGYYAVPDGVTAIEGAAFAGADGLREIHLPATVKELKEGSLILSGGVNEIFLSADRMTISAMLFGNPTEGALVPNIRVCVPEEYYAGYLAAWSQALDPVYGEGTAKRLLQIGDDTVFYENEAKYQKITENGVTHYRLLEVYTPGRTAFQVKEGTSEIEVGAFARSGSLEILYLPDSLKQVETGTFAGCKALQTVTVKSKALLSEGVFDSSAEQVTVYEKGSGFSEFVYDEGIVYGKSQNGVYTLIDVPTDYSADVTVYKNTGYLNKEAFKDCTSVKKIEIPDQKSLSEIGDRCFENCTSLTSISLNTADQLYRVGEEAFRSCTNLKSLYLPERLNEIESGLCYDCTSLQTIMAKGVSRIKEEAFYHCQSLQSGGITLNWNQMTDIGDRAFAYCNMLRSIPNMPKLQSLGMLTFFSCQKLQKVVLPETLTNMGEECFGECGALTQVVMNGKLTGISRYCFYGCRELVTVEFSEQQKDALQVVGVQAFGQCISLESLDLSGFSGLTQMGERTFEGCDFLTTVKFPENLKKVPDYCFENCRNLSLVTFTSDEVTGLGEAVFGDALSPFVHIWVKEEKLSDYENVYKNILDQLYGKGTTANVLGKIDKKTEIIRGITFEITDEGRVLKKVSEAFEGTYTVPVDTIRIDTEAFAGCRKLTDIELPADSQISLGDRCFKGCTALERVDLLGDIPAWGDETFMDCTALEVVYIGGAGKKVPRVGTRAFKGCTGLDGKSALTFRADITALGEECFADCVNLGAIPMTESARLNLEVIEDRAFAGCKGLTQLLTSKFAVKTIGAYAFYDCDSLAGPSIPATVTSIGEGCFSECDNLTTVSFYCALEEYPKDCFKNCPMLSRTGGVDAALSGLKRIGEGAYEGCTSLTTNASWNPGRYSNLEEIGAHAFRGCTSMTEINLSSTVQKIGAGAFDGCGSVGQMTFNSVTVPEIGMMALDTMSNDLKIRVPDSQTEGDSVYQAYLALFTEMFGEDRAYEILDSVSDKAKDRNIRKEIEE